MRPSPRLQLVVSLLSLGLLGAECNFEDLINTDALGIPDPCDQTEISCNGVDEDCDGIDDCAELPAGADDALARALALAELDCDGVDGLLAAALAPLDLNTEAECPAHDTTEVGPIWDGKTECEGFDPDDGTCTRDGEASTTVWTGGCARGEETVDGGLTLAGGRVHVARTTDAGTTTVDQTGALFAAEVPDGVSLSRGDALAHHRVSGHGDRVTTTTQVTDPQDVVTLAEVDGCALVLDLQTDASAPAPLPEDGGSSLLRVQWRRDTEDGEVAWTEARNGNATLQTVAEGEDPGLVSLSWVRDQGGGDDPADCSQTGTTEVWRLDLETNNRLWTVRLDLDAACSPCGDLLVDGEFAGRWCDGALQ